MASNTRVTPEEVVKMHSLYAKLGTYAAVGREMNRSGSTVKRYVKMIGVPQAMQITINNLLQQQQNK